MSSLDTADHVRGVVSANNLLLTGAAGIASTAFNLPDNVVALWLWIAPGGGTPTVTVAGLSTGTHYPVYQFPPNNADSGGPWTLALVSQQADPTVRVTWSAAPTAPWFIVGDTGPRISLDAALAAAIAAPGAANPGAAVQVAGTDGTHLRALLTDATGALVTTGGAFPPVYAAPGAAAPADALQVGGTDGANLRALLLDATGKLLTIDQTLKLAVAALAAASPADAVQVGGSDGANLRALSVDTAGHAQTIDQNLKAAIAPNGAVVPADIVYVGGSSGGVASALRVTGQGQPFSVPSVPGIATADRPPNELLWANLNGAAISTNILAAPGAGLRYRVFFLYAYPNNAAGQYYVIVTSATGVSLILCNSTTAGGQLAPPIEIPLTGIPTMANTPITLGNGGGLVGATIGYTLETI